MTELYIPGFGDSKYAIPRPNRRRKQAKARKAFKPDFGKLFHSELYGSLPTAGETPLPVLEPQTSVCPTRLVPFHEAYAHKDFDCTVHFFIDDRLFLRVLYHPEKYLPFFQKCHSVIGPDLSQYANMSYSERYMCAYINRAFTLYLQQNSVTAIPNVTWSLPDSYEYSFAGMPRYSVVAINSNGVHKNDLSLYRWKCGCKMAMIRLSPLHIIRYGQPVDGENTAISSYFSNERLNILKNGGKRK